MKSYEHMDLLQLYKGDMMMICLQLTAVNTTPSKMAEAGH